MADIFGTGGQIEIDETRTTRTSWIGIIVGFTFVAFSLLSLIFGRGPVSKLLIGRNIESLTGDSAWNMIGWLFGAVLVPLVVIVSHQRELRQSLSPDHIKVSSRMRFLGVILVLGLFISTLHAFLGSMQIRFGV